MRGLMSKAKTGDIAAARLVLGYLTGGGASKSGRKKGRSRQDREAERVVEAEPAAPVMIESPAARQFRRLIALYLVQNMTARIGEMERMLEIPEKDLRGFLNHEWFSETKGVYSVTPEGRNAVA